MPAWALLVVVSLPVTPTFAPPPPWQRPPLFVELRYPAEALAKRVTGAVVVEATTDARGNVVGAKRLAGPEALAPAVLDNLQQWTLSRKGGTEHIVFRFEIDPGACNDDAASFFRLVYPNLAVVTACTGPGRSAIPTVLGDVRLAERAPTTDYPPLARSASAAGIVVVELSVDPSGAVTSSRALGEPTLLTQAAADHTKTWRLLPGTDRRAILVYEFTLDGVHCDPESQTVLSWVAADYVRLTGCPRTIDVGSAGK